MSGQTWPCRGTQRRGSKERLQATPAWPSQVPSRRGYIGCFFLISKTVYASYVNISLKEIYRRLRRGGALPQGAVF